MDTRAQVYVGRITSFPEKKTAEGKRSAVDLTSRKYVECTLQMLLILVGIMMGRENALLPLEGGVLVTAPQQGSGNSSHVWIPRQVSVLMNSWKISNLSGQWLLINKVIEFIALSNPAVMSTEKCRDLPEPIGSFCLIRISTNRTI